MSWLLYHPQPDLPARVRREVLVAPSPRSDVEPCLFLCECSVSESVRCHVVGRGSILEYSASQITSQLGYVASSSPCNLSLKVCVIYVLLRTTRLSVCNVDVIGSLSSDIGPWGQGIGWHTQALTGLLCHEIVVMFICTDHKGPFINYVRGGWKNI